MKVEERRNVLHFIFLIRDIIETIDDDTKRFLITTNPKHKRPIVSSNSQASERVSQFVDHHFPYTY